MFTFEIKHVAGKRHSGPDALSRRRRSPDDSEGEDPEELEDYIDLELSSAYILPQIAEPNNQIPQPNDIPHDAQPEDMPENLQRIKTYLLTLQRPPGMTDKQFDSFKQYALCFLVIDGLLFRRTKANMAPKRVIWNPQKQQEIIRQLHDESGHRATKATYKKIALRYWWKGLYRDVEKWVKTCEPCQIRAPIRVTEELRPSLDNALWARVGLDVVYMPHDAGFSKIVALRDYLTGWLEAKAVKSADSRTISAFLYEWIVRFGIMGELLCDGGSENKKLTMQMINRYRIRNIRVSSYHPQANGLIERGHQPIVDALAKLGKKWVANLALVIWADRITTRASTGYSPFRLVFGQDCVLPVELTAYSWAYINWINVKTTAELLAARAKQLERKEIEVQNALENIRANRIANKRRFDKNRRIRKEKLEIGDMVLLHNTSFEKQWSKKLDNRWLGPYKIRQIKEDCGTYLLNELDGTQLKGTYAGDRIRQFFPREGILDDEMVAEEECEYENEENEEDGSEESEEDQ